MPSTMPSPPPWPEPERVPSTDGVTLAAYEEPGTGRDALFAHANGLCAAVFQPLIAALDPWRRVAVDARAHGNSSRPSNDLAWEGHCEDILATVDSLSLDAAIGIGHSMGGASLLLAEQARPGTFAGLWLFEPIVFPPLDSKVTTTDSENPLIRGALRRRHTFESVGAAYANFASKPPLDELSAQCLAAYVTHGFAPTPEGDSVTLRCRPEDESAGYRMGTRHSAWDHLPEVRCPVVVVRGAEATGGPAMVAPAVANRLADAELEDHVQLGHFGPLAAPAAMASSVRRLAGRIDSSDTP